MRRVVTVLLGLSLLQAAACGSRTQPAAGVGGSPPATAVHTDTLKLFGDRYTVVIQRHEPGDVSSNVVNESSGGQTKEWAEISWGKGETQQGKLVIDKGTLTVNGVSRGEIKRGARIVVDPAGEVTVSQDGPPPNSSNAVPGSGSSRP